MIKRIFAVLIALFVALTPFSAYAADEVEFDTTATQTEVVAALYDTVADGMKVSIDAFAASLEAAGWVWDALTGTYYDPLNNIEYGILLNGLLGRSDRSGGGGRVRVESAADVKISGKTFSEICDQLAEQYAPDLDTQYISWKNEKNPNFRNFLSFYNAGTFCNNDWYECYAVPFIYDGTNYYYGAFQYHYYQVDSYLKMDRYDNMAVYADGLDGYTPVTAYHDVDLATYRYVALRLTGGKHEDCSSGVCSGFANYLQGYKTYADYIAAGDAGEYLYIERSGYSYYYKYACDYIATDGYTYFCPFDDMECDALEPFIGFSAKGSTEEKDLSTDWDIGYYVSNQFIDFHGYDFIDPTKIDPNATVTPSGSNVYEYFITNSDGHTTTINNYITNNYTYITEGEGNGGDTTINNWDISFGDFLIDIGMTIETSISNTLNILFMPSEGFFDGKVTELHNLFETKLPVVADLPDIFNELFVTIDDEGNITQKAGITYDENGLALYPKWSIDLEFWGQEMELVILDFGTFKEVLPKVRTIILVFVYVVYLYRFIQYLPTLIGNIADMGAAGVSASAGRYRDKVDKPIDFEMK